MKRNANNIHNGPAPPLQREREKQIRCNSKQEKQHANISTSDIALSSLRLQDRQIPHGEVTKHKVWWRALSWEACRRQRGGREEAGSGQEEQLVLLGGGVWRVAWRLPGKPAFEPTWPSVRVAARPWTLGGERNCLRVVTVARAVSEPLANHW